MADDKKDVIELKSEEYKAIQMQIANFNQQLAIAQAVAAKEKSRAEEVMNLVNRMQADFDNYRKRNNENGKRMKEDGMVDVFEKLLPILDVLKQAIMMIPDEKVADGVKMIYRQLTDLLGQFGVTEIPALGLPFDPTVHNAIMQVKVKDVDKVGLVVEVFNKGYKLGDRLLRPSIVKVAK